jgi:hypothetical protein
MTQGFERGKFPEKDGAVSHVAVVGELHKHNRSLTIEHATNGVQIGVSKKPNPVSRRIEGGVDGRFRHLAVDVP